MIRLDYINALEAGRSGKKNEFVKFIAEAETETQKDFIRGMHMNMPDFSQANEQKQTFAAREMQQDRPGMDWKQDMLGIER